MHDSLPWLFSPLDNSATATSLKPSGLSSTAYHENNSSWCVCMLVEEERASVKEWGGVQGVSLSTSMFWLFVLRESAATSLSPTPSNQQPLLLLSWKVVNGVLLVCWHTCAQSHTHMSHNTNTHRL